MKGVSEGRVLKFGSLTNFHYQETLGYQNGNPNPDGKITISYERNIRNGTVHEHMAIMFAGVPHQISLEGVSDKPLEPASQETYSHNWNLLLLKTHPRTSKIEWDSEKGLISPEQNKALEATDLDERVLQCVAESEAPYEVRQCLAKFVKGYRA